MQVNAATVDPRLAKSDVCGRYEIVHINGVNTSIEDAQSNLAALALRYGNAHDEHLLRYGLAYNRTNWIIADVQQAYAQLLASYPGIGFRQWLRAVATGIWPESLPAEAIAEIVGSFGLLLGLDRPIPTSDPDLARMLSEIGGSHSPNGRMLIVPHSQGNFYAATIYDQITRGAAGPFLTIPVGQIDVVAVAVPGPRETLRGTGHYVTARRDLVINTIRLLVPTTLPSTANVARADFQGHSFIGNYLSQETSRSQIVAKMATALSSLTSSAVPPTRWLNSSATYIVCGPPAYPYGSPPWLCYWGEHGNFSAPMVRYSVAGIGPEVFRYGSLSEIEPLARAHAQGCYDRFVADRIDQVLTERTYRDIPGCGYGYPFSSPNGRPDTAWIVYSSDAVGTRTNVVSADNPWEKGTYTMVTVETYPTCRRAT